MTGKPCANCGTLHDRRSPFCGEVCKATAEFVRTCRSWLRDPTKQADPEYPAAFDVRLAFLHTGYLGGRVYDEQARHLTPTQKLAIRERDHGLCVTCGDAGTEIDHIAGSSNDPSNLQLLCAKCHHTKTQQSIQVISDRAALASLATFHAELARRIDSQEPLMACDNEQTWATTWRLWPDVTASVSAYSRRVTRLGFTNIVALAAAVSRPTDK